MRMIAAVLVKVPTSCKVRDRGTKPGGRGAVSQLWYSEQCSDTSGILTWFRCFRKRGILNKNSRRGYSTVCCSFLVQEFRSQDIAVVSRGPEICFSNPGFGPGPALSFFSSKERLAIWQKVSRQLCPTYLLFGSCVPGRTWNRAGDEATGALWLVPGICSPGAPVRYIVFSQVSFRRGVHGLHPIWSPTEMENAGCGSTCLLVPELGADTRLGDQGQPGICQETLSPKTNVSA